MKFTDEEIGNLFNRDRTTVYYGKQKPDSCRINESVKQIFESII
jgi:hypothetical protein